MINEFRLGGHSLEELKKMSLVDFAKLVNSRARRNILRNQEDPFYSKFEKDLKLDKTIRTHRRDIIVTPKMVGHTIFVYNGQSFLPIDVDENMLGHYLGEFSFTRKRVRHGKAGIGATKSSTAIATRK